MEDYRGHCLTDLVPICPDSTDTDGRKVSASEPEHTNDLGKHSHLARLMGHFWPLVVSNHASFKLCVHHAFAIAPGLIV